MIDHKMKEELIKNLYQAIVLIDDEELCAKFLDDLCTYKEVEQMAQRLQAAKLLSEGQTYVQVTDKLDISSATLSRVSRCVKYNDGYLSVLEKLKK